MISTIHLSGTLKLTDASPELAELVLSANTYSNPAYAEALRVGRSVWRVPAEICTYRDDRECDGNIVLPRGYLSELLTLLPKGTPLEDGRTQAKVPFPEFQGVTLRPYQKKVVVAASKAEQGVICAPTGSGKTLMGLALLSHLKHRTLVVVHSKELAKQWREVIHDRLGIAAGFIGDGKWTEGEVITIGMLQTLHRNPERTCEMAAQYGTTLVDEVHHVPATTFAEVLSWLPTRYRYGLSATPHRRDGLDVLIHRVVGPTLAQVSTKDVQKAGATVPAVVKIIESGFFPGVVDSWVAFVNALVNDGNRNQLIVDIAEKSALKVPVLVLVERIEHAEFLAALVRVPCVLVHGSMPAKERAAAMVEIQNANITIGTVGLLGEGLDVAGWGALILASPISSRTRLLQAIGRIVRPHEGKVRGYVADIVDRHPLAMASFRKRCAIYDDQKIQFLQG